jgi:multiple sugar transport system ATP-binding protein
MNMVDAQQTAQALTAHGVELPITEAQRAAVQAHGNAELVYGLRPESISFAATGLPGTLSMIEPTGPETYATVDTPAGKLTARVPGVLQAAVGDAVHLQWSAEQAHLFDRKSGSRVG